MTSPTSWLADQARMLWNLQVTPEVIPNPYEPPPARTAPPRQRDEGPDRGLRILFLGMLQRRKGVFTLAEALRSWFDARGEGTVTWVGQDNHWKADGAARIAAILGRHAQRCTFLPEQCGISLNAAIRQADLVVLPSFCDNAPYSCVEAMAHARPVVTTTGSGTREFIIDRWNGILVPPGNAPALTAALTEAAADRTAVRTLGENARRSLELRLSPEQTTGRLCNAYSRLAGSPAD
ncbi:glycosyltransferase family 4 protein [Streptomyces sp. NPDC090741]|uniref:glycosyltransferase family 4 protein n=1 Tax=Streptomyces sp. NPDC090741 TaxID=3365967 RepID=UPI0037F467FE